MSKKLSRLKKIRRHRLALWRRYRARAAHDAKLARHNRRLARRRLREIRKLQRQHKIPTGAAKACKWALSQVGTTEHPANSNWGTPVQDWIKASGYNGPVPWCQCFANAAAVQGGAPQLRTGYTPLVMRGLGGYTPISLSEVKAGDFIFYKWPGVSSDPCDHVGLALGPIGSLVNDVEGNTSFGNSGSQNNGGAVAHRTDRSRSLVVGAVRPPYPH